ncbi:hypothetical protein M885DRAFT_623131 [Pelagophyceae sp. CCMP2097]|nr:hypothetical protein M885DRAFT_623131 [Pelagophyceae sp. CCMP2097]
MEGDAAAAWRFSAGLKVDWYRRYVRLDLLQSEYGPSREQLVAAAKKERGYCHIGNMFRVAASPGSTRVRTVTHMAYNPDVGCVPLAPISATADFGPALDAQPGSLLEPGSRPRTKYEAQNVTTKAQAREALLERLDAVGDEMQRKADETADRRVADRAAGERRVAASKLRVAEDALADERQVNDEMKQYAWMAENVYGPVKAADATAEAACRAAALRVDAAEADAAAWRARAAIMLHLENRSREAFFSRILNRVFDPARTTVEVKAKLAAVEDWQTKITVNVKSDAINKLTFNNDRIRKIMKSVGHDVVDMCFGVNDPGRAHAHEALDLYEKLIDKLRQHGDLSGTEIDEVSTLRSATYGKYLDTFGYEGFTNYWHIIGSCYLVYYLRNYGSLYRYQNQGWEHMNHLLKRFFFTRTQRGGRNGAGARSSRVRAVGKWMQRRLMWLCDFADAPAVNVRRAAEARWRTRDV